MEKDFKPHGYLTLTNWGGIEIEINDTNESVRYRYFGNVGRKPCKICYTNNGRAYIRVYGRRYYLDEFMRVGYPLVRCNSYG